MLLSGKPVVIPDRNDRPWTGRRRLIFPVRKELRWPAEYGRRRLVDQLGGAGVGDVASMTPELMKELDADMVLLRLIEEALKNALGYFRYRTSNWDTIRTLLIDEQQNILSTLWEKLRELDGSEDTGEVSEVNIFVLRGCTENVRKNNKVRKSESCIAPWDYFAQLFAPCYRYDLVGGCSSTEMLSTYASPDSVPSLEELGMEDELVQVEMAAEQMGDAYLFKLHQTYQCSVLGGGHEASHGWESELVLLQIRKKIWPDRVMTIQASTCSTKAITCTEISGRQENLAENLDLSCATLGDARRMLCQKLQTPRRRLQLVSSDGALLTEAEDPGLLYDLCSSAIAK